MARLLSSWKQKTSCLLQSVAAAGEEHPTHPLAHQQPQVAPRQAALEPLGSRLGSRLWAVQPSVRQPQSAELGSAAPP